jgi:hypothetical protein
MLYKVGACFGIQVGYEAVGESLIGMPGSAPDWSFKQTYYYVNSCDECIFILTG